MAFRAYRGMVEIDCGDAHRVGWLHFKGKTGNVSSLPERQVPVKMPDRKEVLLTEILSQVDVTHESSDRLSLKDVHEDAVLSSMDDYGDANDGYSVDREELEDEPKEKVAWYFHDLQDFGQQGTPAL